MDARANRHRGEVEATINGERRILCLTLGALAELETAFGVDNIADLAARFTGGRMSAAGLICILGAGLRGGGNRMSDEDVAMSQIDGGVEGAVRLASLLFASAFASERGEAPQNPPPPQQAG
jgi:hypothetical protein